MNLNPFIELLSSILHLFKFSLVLHIAIEWLTIYKVINPHQPFIYRVSMLLNKIFEPTLDYIRRFIKPIAGVDLSPIVLFLAIRFIDSSLYTYLYR
jgi:YggT family protein